MRKYLFTGNPPHFPRGSEAELCVHGQPLFWCYAAQVHVLALVIVVSHQAGGVVLDLGLRVENVLRHPFVMHGSVEALDLGILLRLARFDVFDADATAFSPAL